MYWFLILIYHKVALHKLDKLVHFKCSVTAAHYCGVFDCRIVMQYLVFRGLFRTF